MSIHVPDAKTVLKTYSLLTDAPTPHLRDGDIGRLSSTIQMANTTYEGVEMYEGIHSKVAAVIDNINRTHPLVDGNKRLSCLVMVMLYEGNGYTYVGTDSQADLFVWIADSHPSNASMANKLSQLWE